MKNILNHLQNLVVLSDETPIRELGNYIKSVPLDKEINFSDSGLPIKSNAGVNIQVEYFNPQDSSSNDVLGELTQGSHYLSHRVGINAGLMAEHSNEQLRLAFEATANLGTFYAVKHHGNMQIGNAIKEDWSNYKTFFKRTNILNLNKGDILGLEWEGDLEASASFSWSNAVGRSLNTVAKILNHTGTVDVTVSSGITVGFDVSIKDHYILAVKRVDEDQFHLKVLKKKLRSRAFSLTAGLEVEFSEPDQAGGLVGALAVQLVEKISGKQESEIISALEKADQRNEDIQDTTFVNLIVDRLPENIREFAETSLVEKYTHYKNYLAQEIAKRVKENIKMTLGYQYNRVKESEELLSCKMNLQTLEGFHHSLRRFSIRPLLNAILKGNVNVELLSYLKMESIMIKRSWGLSLNILGFRLDSNNDRERNVSISTNINDQKQISDHRLFIYKSKLGNYSHNWGISFQADMSNFSVAQTPKLNEFVYQLSLFHSKGLRITNEDKLRDILDTAFLWGDYNKTEIDKLITSIFQDVKGKLVEVNTQLKFSNEATFILLNQLGLEIFDRQTSSVILLEVSKAFGAAMPYWGNFKERIYPETRSEIYKHGWIEVFNGVNVGRGYDFSRIRSLSELQLSPGFIRVESEQGSNRYLTLADMNHGNGQHIALRNLFSAFHELKNGIQSRRDYNSNYDRNVIQPITAIRSQSIYVRSLGRLFAGIIPYALAKDHVEFSAGVVYRDGDGEEVERVLVN